MPETYRHEVRDCVYLCRGNQITWGFRYQDVVGWADEMSTRELVEIELLGLAESEDHTAGCESWFKSFVKVIVQWLST